MICCTECFCDKEIKAAIEIIGRKGDCPLCSKKDVWIYDSDTDADNSYVEELLDSILDIYVPQSKLPNSFPKDEVDLIESRLASEWNIFSGGEEKIRIIVQGLVENSLELDEKIVFEPVGIPQLFDDLYLDTNAIMGKNSWLDFKKYLRNINRFHSKHINLEMLSEILKETEIKILKEEKFYRARVSNEKGIKGFTRREMCAPPDDAASPGRVNSKGQSCLYLSSKKKTTIKEIRAHAFDYVTIATFKLNRDVKVLDLSSITHNSPFYANTEKTAYLINEKILRAMEMDLAKPMSRWDSELDYLPTQYISDFAKFLGYDGVKFFSTFDKKSYNLALFDDSVCRCVYNRNFRVGDLDYKINAV